MEQAGVALIAQGASAYFSDMKSATSATNTFVDATEKGSGRVSAAGQVMIGGLRHIGTVAVDAFGKALKATAAFVGDSIDLAGDFEQGMLNFQSVAGKDVDTSGLEEFRDLFIDIGKRLPVSTTEVQQAATELVKGGIDPAVVAAGGLESSIQFAAAAMGGDLVQAAEISAKVVGGWADVNATAAEKTALLTHSQDLLTKAANASTVGVDDLALGLYNVQGSAKTAGLSLDETVTALAELAPRFSSANTAGTAFRTFLTRLQPSTDPAIDAMSDLGLYTEELGSIFFDAKGEFVGVAEASDLLQKAFSGLTDAERLKKLQEIFGEDAKNAAAAFMEMGAQGFNNMAAALDNANGVADAAALKQAGFNTSLDNTKGSVEALQIQLGTHLLPILGNVLDNYITPGINAFSDWSSAILGAEDPLLALVQSIDLLAPGLGSIIGYITTLVTEGDSLNDFLTTTPPLFQDIVDVAGSLFTLFSDNLDIIIGVGAALGSFAILTTVAGWVSGAVTAVTAFGTALTAAGGGIAGVVALLGGPVTLAIGAVALAVGVLTVAWQNNWGDIQGKTAAVWATLEPIFKTATNWLGENIPKAIKTLSAFWTDTLQPALKVVWGFLNDKVFPVLSDLTDIYIAAAIIEVKALAALWTNVLQPALKVVYDFMSGTVIPIFVALFQVQWAIAMKAGEALAGLWQKVLQPAFKTVSDYVTGTVVPALTSIGDYLNQTFGPALKSITDWLGKVTGGFNGVTGGVKGVVEWIGKLATSISTLKLPSWLTPGSPTPWEIALYGIGTALSKSVGPGLKDMQAGVQEIGAQISETFQNTDIIDMLTDIGKDAMAGFGKGLKSGLRGVMSIVESTANTVEDAFRGAFQSKSPSERMVPVGESITQGIMQGLAGMWPTLMDTVSSLSDDLIGQVADIGQQINGIIADSFGATASIDRQIASNIGKMKDVLPDYQQYTEGALKVVEKEARAFLDPAEGAKFFKMRSNQIFEYAKLQKELSEAQGVEDKARIQAQMSLIAQAHRAEISQFDANKAAQGNPMQELIAQMHQLFNNEKKAALEEQLAKAKTDAERARIQAEINAAAIPVNDTGVGHDLQALIALLTQIFGAPHRAGGGPVERNQPYWVGEHGPELFWPQMSGMVSPAASSQQMAARGNQTTYNGQVGNTYNMPVYTNNTQGAIQQSWAIMQASMP